MNRQLAAAIINTFCDLQWAQHANTLRSFSTHGWKRTFHWLDASGLALYFLHRIGSLNLEDCVPRAVLAGLAQRQADNNERTASLFKEFLRINAAFAAARLRYVNLKGFSLIPDYCPTPSLRYQIDCDFLIERSNADICADILANLGYSLVARTVGVLEFKTEPAGTPHIRDLYKTDSQRSVEVHLCDSTRSNLHPSLIDRACVVTNKDYSYPVLSAEDMFLSQASHLFRHLCSEWTRISWLLEFRYFVLNRKGDGEFWQQIHARVEGNRQAAVFAGTVLKLAQKAFGTFRVEQLDSWSVERLPPSVALWVDRYGGDVLLSDFPGSKLYLLLERAICGGEASGLIRRKLFPMRAPGPVDAAASPNGLRRRTMAAAARWHYLFFRLRFHVRANSRYVFELWRWNRLCTHVPHGLPIGPIA
jgi:hypothetical protein